MLLLFISDDNDVYRLLLYRGVLFDIGEVIALAPLIEPVLLDVRTMLDRKCWLKRDEVCFLGLFCSSWLSLIAAPLVVALYAIK